MESKKANKQKTNRGGGIFFSPNKDRRMALLLDRDKIYLSLSLSLSPDYLNEEICDIAIENIEDLTRVVISYEIYETSLRRVS